ncbi:hypothetical protein [Clostridium perfringens]|uniref:hypothetical protein n=1 Tax=Clostridium perfringens TaxID=1502 RepID=UPI00234216E8|nr:hypothetical protein [Clostridium perfringens]MDC4245697.1 hypothetical protein [Clostridium perfringens]
MLKVGDKVKIKENLEVGQKYDKCEFVQEMKKYRGNLAKIEFVCNRFMLLDIDNQNFAWTEDMFDKVEGDNNMKELTFKEVVVNIKEDEVWESNEISIFKTKDNISIDWKNGSDNGVLIFDDEKFRLKRKEYNFEEAFKSFKKGKEIESEYGTKYKFDKTSFEVTIIETQYEDKTSIYSFEDTLFRCDEIQNKWYIND